MGRALTTRSGLIARRLIGGEESSIGILREKDEKRRCATASQALSWNSNTPRAGPIIYNVHSAESARGSHRHRGALDWPHARAVRRGYANRLLGALLHVPPQVNEFRFVTR